jgi:hypothetical protein
MFLRSSSKIYFVLSNTHIQWRRNAPQTLLQSKSYVSLILSKRKVFFFTPSTHLTQLTLAAFKCAQGRRNPLPYNDFEELESGDPDEAARCLRFAGFASVRSDLISWIELDGEIADPEDMTGRRQNRRWWKLLVRRWRSRS